MATGYKDFSANNGVVRVNYSYTQDQASNTTSVEVTSIQFKSTNWWGTNFYADGTVKAGSGSVSFNGHETATHNSCYIERTGEFVAIGDRNLPSFTVQHDSSGAGSFTIKLSARGGSGFQQFNMFCDASTSGNYATTGTKTVTLPTINRYALSLSPEAVSTGNSVSITVANGSGVTFTASIQYTDDEDNTTVLATQSFDTGSCSIACDKAWFDDLGITEDQSVELDVVVTGGPETMTETLTLNAGDDMLPVVGTPTISLVQASSASLFPSTWLANLSKAKVEAAVTLPTDAEIYGVVLSNPGGTSVAMTYNSGTGKYEGTTAGPISGDTVFTVTAVDERGLAGSNTVSLTGVVPYTPPAVTIDKSSTWRCNSSGTKTRGGTYYRVRATATICTDLSGNSIKKLTTSVRGVSGSMHDITSGTQSQPFGDMANTNAVYTVVVTVQDQVSGEITAELTLDGAQRYVVVTRSNDGTYVGVGMEPTRSSGASSIELPAGSKILIGGQEVGVLPTLGDLAYEDIAPIANGGTGADNAADALINLGLSGALLAQKATLEVASQPYNIDISDATTWLAITSCPTNSGYNCDTVWIFIKNVVAAQMSNNMGVTAYIDSNSNGKVRISSDQANTYVWLIPLP